MIRLGRFSPSRVLRPTRTPTLKATDAVASLHADPASRYTRCMRSYVYGQNAVPAARSATQQDPWTCPWCGERTWYVSDGDDERDEGRMQMYCDNSSCVSRETELIIMRGEGVHWRADVRALNSIDDGGAAGEQPLVEVDLTSRADNDEMDRRHGLRIKWRQSRDPYTLVVG